MVIGSDMSHDLWGPWREEAAADHEEERYYLNTDTGEKRAADDPPPADARPRARAAATCSRAPRARQSFPHASRAPRARRARDGWSALARAGRAAVRRADRAADGPGGLDGASGDDCDAAADDGDGDAPADGGAPAGAAAAPPPAVPRGSRRPRRGCCRPRSPRSRRRSTTRPGARADDLARRPRRQAVSRLRRGLALLREELDETRRLQEQSAAPHAEGAAGGAAAGARASRGAGASDRTRPRPLRWTAPCHQPG